MFGIGWSELVLIGVAALLFLGPEKLPGMAQTLGRWVRELRAASADLREEFGRELRQDAWDLRTPPPGRGPVPPPRAEPEAPPATSPLPSVEGFARPVRRGRPSADG